MRAIGLAVIVLVGGSFAALGANAAKPTAVSGMATVAREATLAAGCERATGELVDLDASGSRTIGTMRGFVAGAYVFDHGGVVASDPENDAIVFGVGTSTVTTADGELTLRETASTDSGAQSSDVNTAVLATVLGGSGRWTGASGHLVYAGFFHAATLTGQFRYTGTICTPARSRFAGAPPSSASMRSATGCEPMAGRLAVSASGGRTLGAMEGSVAGAYELAFGGAVGSDPDDPARIFAAGTATVTNDEGTLTLRETASEDTADQSSDVNAAVLATIVSGTGRWAEASGHLVYAGYFHAATLTGEFTYSGTVCSAVAPPPATPSKPPPKRPKKPPSAYGRGIGASMRALSQCPPRRVLAARTRGGRGAVVCGFQATFAFSSLPAAGSTLRTAWYYNRRFVGTVPKPKAKVVKSFIAFSRAAPRGFYWCDLIVKPPGKPAKTVARSVVRR